jgi:hypothetical protein
LTDQWFNTMPPQRSEAYLGETGGTVFRYQNGVVSQAPGYGWYGHPMDKVANKWNQVALTRISRARPAMGHEGRIVRFNHAGDIDGYPAVYRAQSVFACSALLPMIVTDGDASLGYAFMRRCCPCDLAYDQRGYSAWSHLHFGGGDDGQGVSYVYSNASGDPWVAGSGASWMPSLVPSVYKNTDPSAPPSRGLSGHLPIILALMAFHGRPGRASEVFRERKWNLGQWLGSNRASSYRP